MAFKSKITDSIKTLQAIEWYKNYYYNGSNEIYMGIAGTTDWADDADPDEVDSSVTALTELIGISKATVDFVKETVSSGADIVYADGTYWNRYTPNDPASEDYDNIISEGIFHLYIETVIAHNLFPTNTFRKISVNHNPLDSLSALCTNNSYNASNISSQGDLQVIGHSSKIDLISGQSLNVGLIMRF